MVDCCKLDQQEDSLECEICCTEFDVPKILKCGHTFCLKCCQKLLTGTGKSKKINCPTCRKDTGQLITAESLTTVYRIQQLIDSKNNPVQPTKKARLDCFDCISCKKSCERDHVWYCEQCNVAICAGCAMKSHRDHSGVNELKTCLDKQRNDLELVLGGIQSRISASKNENQQIDQIKNRCLKLCNDINEICCKAFSQSDDIVCKLQTKHDELKREIWCESRLMPMTRVCVMNVEIEMNRLRDATFDEAKQIRSIKSQFEKVQDLLEKVAGDVATTFGNKRKLN